ncbi:MAG: aminoglycoside phosphotransferase family protein [Clostridia bacterium]|nr:aminoglycoside phosphotransferase family protein [Clostridia bacterium]
MKNKILEICKAFQISGTFYKMEEIHSGHINSTFRVYFTVGENLNEYIVQKVNTNVFVRPVEMMENISSVTEFIREKLEREGADVRRFVMQYLSVADGRYYHVRENGEFWRCCRFIENSVSFLNPENTKVVEESGVAFGAFQKYLYDYPVDKLHIVIPHFHNTIMRYGAFREAIKADLVGRKSGIEDVIAGYFSLEEVATEPYKMQRRGELPLRVTHNDTKISNVLFDLETYEHLSVIDLDTVMPGLVAFDFGDAIRIAGNTGEEDERDLARVALDMEKYEAFTRGFLKEVRGFLTENEKKSLPLGAVAMTVECGVRFLTDYLNGDTYFKTHYSDQNLVRAKCHLALAKDMLRRFEEMQEIVEKYCQ